MKCSGGPVINGLCEYSVIYDVIQNLVWDCMRQANSNGAPFTEAFLYVYFFTWDANKSGIWISINFRVNKIGP